MNCKINYTKYSDVKVQCFFFTECHYKVLIVFWIDKQKSFPFFLTQVFKLSVKCSLHIVKFMLFRYIALKNWNTMCNLHHSHNMEYLHYSPNFPIHLCSKSPPLTSKCSLTWFLFIQHYLFHNVQKGNLIM